jgi:hypothetical protein
MKTRILTHPANYVCQYHAVIKSKNRYKGGFTVKDYNSRVKKVYV